MREHLPWCSTLAHVLRNGDHFPRIVIHVLLAVAYFANLFWDDHAEIRKPQETDANAVVAPKTM